jgi:glyoxylase-like metal-dependent hydrolase (beta-lactamase superfamily II)
VRDISKVVRALTSLPVTALVSHLHFDHTGNIHRFGHLAMADLPVLRGCDQDGWFRARDDLFAGAEVGMDWVPVRISEWIAPGSVIDLGGRSVELWHTPGHSPDSVSLYDRGADLLLAADFIYPGPLYAQFPGADVMAYRETAMRLADRLGEATAIYAAHGAANGEGRHSAPRLARSDLEDLEASLGRLLASGERPASWPVNARMSLLLAEAAFTPWQDP